MFYLFICVRGGGGCPQRSENFLHVVFVHKMQGKHYDWPNNVIMVKGITCTTPGKKGRKVQ